MTKKFQLGQTVIVTDHHGHSRIAEINYTTKTMVRIVGLPYVAFNRNTGIECGSRNKACSDRIEHPTEERLKEIRTRYLRKGMIERIIRADWDNIPEETLRAIIVEISKAETKVHEAHL